MNFFSKAFTLCAAFLALASASQAQQCMRFVQGGSAPGDDYAYGFAADAAGNQYLCGTFEGNANFGGQALSTTDGAGFLAKYNPQGTCDWAIKADGSNMQGIWDVELDPAGNVHVTGMMGSGQSFPGLTAPTEGGFYAVLTPQGNFIRGFTMGENVGFTDLAIDGSGAIYGTGVYLNNNMVVGNSVPGSEGYFLARINDQATGLDWLKVMSRTVSQSGDMIPTKVAAHPQGGAVWQRLAYSGDSLAGQALAFPGGSGMLTGYYSAQGGLSQEWKIDGSAVPGNPAVADNGDIYISGTALEPLQAGTVAVPNGGSIDAFVMKLLAGGGFTWGRGFGGADDEYGNGLQILQNRVYLSIDYMEELTAGSTTLLGLDDVAIIEMTTDNQILNSYSFGGDGIEISYGFSKTPAGHLVLVGSFEESVTTGACQMNSLGVGDAYAATFAVPVSAARAIAGNEMQVLPNPAHGAEVRLAGLKASTTAGLILRDASGRQVLVLNGMPSTLEEGLKASLPLLPAGFYTVSLSQAGRTVHHKWTVEK